MITWMCAHLCEVRWYRGYSSAENIWRRSQLAWSSALVLQRRHCSLR